MTCLLLLGIRFYLILLNWPTKSLVAHWVLRITNWFFFSSSPLVTNPTYARKPSVRRYPWIACWSVHNGALGQREVHAFPCTMLRHPEERNIGKTLPISTEVSYAKSIWQQFITYPVSECTRGERTYRHCLLSLYCMHDIILYWVNVRVRSAALWSCKACLER